MIASINTLSPSSCNLEMKRARKNFSATMKELDNDGSGQICYTEFLAATLDTKKILHHDLLWQVFKQFDLENTGAINMDDLTAILTGGKEKKFDKVEAAMHEEIRATMEKYDTGKTGDIRFEEFLAMMQENTENVKASIDPESPRDENTENVKSSMDPEGTKSSTLKEDPPVGDEHEPLKISDSTNDEKVPESS